MRITPITPLASASKRWSRSTVSPRPASADDEPGERGGVLVQHRAERGIAQLREELPDRDALLVRGMTDLAHGDAEREQLEDHRQAEHDEADRRVTDSCGSAKRLYASYSEKMPPPKNRKSATTSAQKYRSFP